MSKEKSPAYQRYPKDYVSDIKVQSMSLEEEGMYNRLMDYCWCEVALPADPKILSALCKGKEPTALVLSCFIAVRSESDPSAMVLRHKRLDEERKKQADHAARRSLAGQKGNEKRWGKPKKPKKIIAIGSQRDDFAIAIGSQTIALQSSSSSSIANNTPIPPQGGSAEAVISIPLAGGKDFHVTPGMKAEFEKLYPGIDVLQELRAARGWCLTNPARCKTHTGCPRFLNSWLARAQNNGRNRATDPGPQKPLGYADRVIAEAEAEERNGKPGSGPIL